ncbi:DUF3592 domain-containing protein [bacterium SCSIO 12696]|nr:DUF3592 domain-containing protein [bacterium SCSIO 12696]
MDLATYIQEMWQLAVQGKAQGIWFFAALYLLATCAYSLVFQIRTRSWPFTQGALVELDVEKFGGTDLVRSNQEYVAEALYKYCVSNIAYEGKRISPWVFVASHNVRLILQKQMSSVQQLPDGKVKVFYNPKNPKKSYLIVAGKMGICITVLIGVLPLILFYGKYY